MTQVTYKVQSAFLFYFWLSNVLQYFSSPRSSYPRDKCVIDTILSFYTFSILPESSTYEALRIGEQHKF